MSKIKLSPCPFCGFTAPKIVSNGIGDFFVRCDSDDDSVYSCGASTSDVRCESEEQAARRWNCRPTAGDEVEALARELLARVDVHLAGSFQRWHQAEALREALAIRLNQSSQAPNKEA